MKRDTKPNSIPPAPSEMDKAVRNMFALKPADVKRILKGPGKKRGV